MISAFILSQILIGIAFLFDLASFQFKERKATLLCFAAAAALIAAHFFVLGAITAGAVIAVSAVRFLVSIFSTDARLMYVFLLITLGLGAYTFSEYTDLIITAAILISTYAAFQKNEKRLRQFMMITTSLAITYNIIIFSPAAIALEVFFLGSNLFSYWRFYLRKNQDSITS